MKMSFNQTIHFTKEYAIRNGTANYACKGLVMGRGGYLGHQNCPMHQSGHVPKLGTEMGK